MTGFDGMIMGTTSPITLVTLTATSINTKIVGRIMPIKASDEVVSAA